MKDNSIYLRCYFFIESGYVWGKGMDKEHNIKFNNEIRELFKRTGFIIKEPEFNSACIEVWRGAENLYCHPQDLVGYLKEGSIKEIELLLKEAKTFEFRYAKTYEKVYNYTEEELKEVLENNRPKLEQKILEIFKTKRRNLYKSSNLIYDLETDIKFFKNELSLKNMEKNFVLTLFIDLVKEGKLIESQNDKIGKIYRTAIQKIRNDKKYYL